ncbi:MAG: response regulator receiver protein [Pseudobdellovibrio sp.]|jgi:DNA-binding response OmpR family regulator|nr:response regulator receiver protein [Pseudobdellovibrio sp.]
MEKSLVMIVDDDAVFNNTLSAAVKKMGHHVLQVYSAAEASNILFTQQIKPELLICDVNMPQKSGFDLLKEVITKNMNVRVCMISGSDERSNRLASLQLGAVDFISKPLEMGKVSETVSKLLNQPSV